MAADPTNQNQTTLANAIDSDGDMKGVTLSELASQQIRSMLAREDDGDSKGLRVFIEQGGCSGMKYSMTFDIFRDGDTVAEKNGMKVFVDNISIDYLNGAVIDFSEDLTGGGFKITNPNARQSCGCGKSFEV